jgi:hypothetical protein
MGFQVVVGEIGAWYGETAFVVVKLGNVLWTTQPLRNYDFPQACIQGT